MEFRLPELGEGIADATVVNVSVKAGDSVTAGQTLLEVETDKASMPVPAPANATIQEVRVKPGDKIKVGAVLMVFAATASGGRKPADSATAASGGRKPADSATAASGGRKPADSANATVHNQGADAPRSPQDEPVKNGSTVAVPAGPATRRLARELGVNLSEIAGSARGGRVVIDDVKAHARKRISQSSSTALAGGSRLTVPLLPDFSKFGPVETKPIGNLRRKIAENLTISWQVIPAVTQFDLADITDLESGRKRVVESSPKGSAKITMTVLAVKAVVAALKEFPNFNSALDTTSGQQILKQYFHVGIAVDTERGLVVPVIRDADRKGIRDLAKEVAELAEKARAGKLTIDEMRGGCFTITNLGGIGGTAFSPIINYPEVAILGIARSSLQPVIRNGNVEARLMMPLCLTYDHRVIDGADGARFTTRLVQLFSDPIRLLMES